MATLVISEDGLRDLVLRHVKAEFGITPGMVTYRVGSKGTKALNVTAEVQIQRIIKKVEETPDAPA